jgi:type I restriction enzyme, S subunit
MVEYVRRQDTGSTIPLINLSVLRNLPIALPPLGEQQEIVSVLKSLDDKIELNHRMSVTLEQVAQSLFKSWFIDFDPVKAKAVGRLPEGMDAETATLFPSTFEKCELGLIPKGWLCKQLIDVFEINPQRRLPKGQVATYLDMASVPTTGHRPTSWTEREMGSGMKFINGDTLLARITPCLENGKTAFVDFLAQDEVGWGSTEFIVLRPRLGLPNYFAYLLCRHNDFRSFAIQSMTGTSGRQRVPPDQLGKYKVAVPPPQSPIGDKFGELIMPLVRKISQNSVETQKLAGLRDILLPKLVSGQLRIPDIEHGGVR